MSVSLSLVAAACRVVLELDPIGKVMLVRLLIIVSAVIVSHQLNVIFFEMLLHFLENRLLGIAKLSPYLNSEDVFTANVALVQQSYA